jgi:hypothetical protein
MQYADYKERVSVDISNLLGVENVTPFSELLISSTVRPLPRRSAGRCHRSKRASTISLR